MKASVIPLPMPDGNPRVVVLEDGTRVPAEGMSVELNNLVQRHIADGALRIVEDKDEKPAKESKKEK